MACAMRRSMEIVVAAIGVVIEHEDDGLGRQLPVMNVQVCYPIDETQGQHGQQRHEHDCTAHSLKYASRMFQRKALYIRHIGYTSG